MTAGMAGYEESPVDFEALCKRAEETLGGRSRSYIVDANAFAKYILGPGKAAIDNLTATQERCTVLLEQRRALADFIESLLRVPPEERDQATFDAKLGSAYDAAKAMK